MKSKKIINDGSRRRRRDARRHARSASPPSSRGDGQPALGGRPSTVRARARSALVIGGGSGHEPTFLGFVGKGLADAAAIGNVFASPPPDPILACAKAANGGAGVLFLYGNYAGDVMNFDMAAEMAAMDDIEVRTVLTTDDVASAPRDRRAAAPRRRRQFLHLQGGGCGLRPDAAASTSVERIARKANAQTFTMGVALSPCSLPQTRRPNFEIGADEMEIGMGIHGEPGDRARAAEHRRRDRRRDAWTASLPRWRPRAATGRRAGQLARLDAADGALHHEPPGAAAAGRCSASAFTRPGSATIAPRWRWPAPRSRCMHLDDELQTMLDHPCDCAMFRAGLHGEDRRHHDSTQMFARHRRRDRWPSKDELCRLDGVIGDADHGIAMALGFAAAREALAALDAGRGADGGAQHGGQGVPERRRRLVRPALRHGADARRGGGQGQGRRSTTPTSSPWSQAMAKGIQDRGKAEPARRRWSTPGRRPPRQRARRRRRQAPRRQPGGGVAAARAGRGGDQDMSGDQGPCVAARRAGARPYRPGRGLGRGGLGSDGAQPVGLSRGEPALRPVRCRRGG